MSRARVLVGTCSWADKGMLESEGFYPRRTMAADERLRFYATQFPYVEVDSTYYAIPPPDTVQRWCEATPPDFVFDVKAFRLLTQHTVPAQVLPQDALLLLPSQARRRQLSYHDLPVEARTIAWRQFKASLEPLRDAGKLGTLVFQFPPWFNRTVQTLEYLQQLSGLAAPYPVAVEFRNAEWLSEEHRAQTLALLRDTALGYVAVDEPQGFASSVPPVVAATGPLAVVRFHGRNRETWERPGATAAERFNYDYPEAELREWAPRIAALTKQVDEIHLAMNTNWSDQGPRNARTLARVLGLKIGGPGEIQQLSLGL